MAMSNVECVTRLAQYLDVHPGKLEISDKNILYADYDANSSPIKGFGTIIQTLARKSKCCDILDSEREAQALSQQWLEYITVCVNHADLPLNTKRVLKELNIALKDVTYITGTKKTITDVTLYYVLYPIMKELNLQEKVQYIHVSRWFDNIQQEERLRQELDLIPFDLLHLFL